MLWAMTSAPTAWANRITSYGAEPVENILAHPQNFKVHSALQQQAMTGALERVGWVQPVIINTVTGNLLDGHMRVMLSLRHGVAEVPAVYVELSEDEEREALLYLFQTAEYAGVDRDILRDVLADARRTAEGLASQPGVQQMLGDLQKLAKRSLPMAPELPAGDGGLFPPGGVRPLAQTLHASASPPPGDRGDEGDDEGDEPEAEARPLGSGRGNVELRERDYGPERIALSAVLTKADHKRWNALKGALRVKGDGAAIVALLDKLDSGELRLAGEG